MVNVSQSSDTREKIILSMDHSKGFTRLKDQNLNKSDPQGQTKTYVGKHDSLLTSQDDLDVSSRMDVYADNSKDFINIKSTPQKDTRYLKPSLSMSFSDADPDISVVNETPCMDGIFSTCSPGSITKDEKCCSTSTTIESSSFFSDQFSFQSTSLTNCSKASPKGQCSVAATPEKNATLNSYSSMTETESSLDLSVNSHIQKRRKSMYQSLVNSSQGQSGGAPDCPGSVKETMTSGDAIRKIEFSESNYSEHYCKSIVHHLPPSTCGTSSVSVGSVMDKRLEICCSLCKSPLGLPENNLHVTCSITSSSKLYLESLHNEILKSQTGNTSAGIRVLITDISSVDYRVCHEISEGTPGQGVWCEKDGFVFGTILCPFCRHHKSSHDNFLGVQVMATNASNVHLLNKIMFYLDQLEITNFEASSDRATKDKDFLPVNGSNVDKVAILNPFDKFSYSPVQQDQGGWRTTKSKLKLPKRPSRS